MSIFRKLNQFEFHHVIEATRGVCLVIFTGPGCSSCKAWKALLAEYQGQHPELQLFEIDAEEDTGLVREFDVFHLPSMFLFIGGQFHCEFQSEASVSAIENTLNTQMSAPSQELP
jgi:thioredoxin-like negative regulator of GroEL